MAKLSDDECVYVTATVGVPPDGDTLKSEVGHVTVGASLSTYTLNVHCAVCETRSVAVHVTVVPVLGVLTGNELPLALSQVIVGANPELSEAVTE
jgi:predicted membrane-bound spermidine synthase